MTRNSNAEILLYAVPRLVKKVKPVDWDEKLFFGTVGQIKKGNRHEAHRNQRY